MLDEHMLDEHMLDEHVLDEHVLDEHKYAPLPRQVFLSNARRGER